MKKIPTLFVREYDERGNVVGVTKEVAAGMEWVLAGDGEATEKVDGSACAIINGELYKRFDAKEGRAVPEGAIPCQPTCDQYTGHWPHWVKVDPASKGDKWFIGAITNNDGRTLEVNLDFLKDGEHSFTSFEDGINADRQAMDYKKRTSKVNKDTKLTIKMVRNGGFCGVIE